MGVILKALLRATLGALRGVCVGSCGFAAQEARIKACLGERSISAFIDAGAAGQRSKLEISWKRHQAKNHADEANERLRKKSRIVARVVRLNEAR
jgi:hypothetical protein